MYFTVELAWFNDWLYGFKAIMYTTMYMYIANSLIAFAMGYVHYT